jgi:hypothetical protein
LEKGITVKNQVQVQAQVQVQTQVQVQGKVQWRRDKNNRTSFQTCI